MGVNIECIGSELAALKLKDILKMKSSNPCYKIKKKLKINLSPLFRLFVVFALGTSITHALHSLNQLSSMRKSETVNEVPSFICKIHIWKQKIQWNQAVSVECKCWVSFKQTGRA